MKMNVTQYVLYHIIILFQTMFSITVHRSWTMHKIKNIKQHKLTYWCTIIITCYPAKQKKIQDHNGSSPQEIVKSISRKKRRNQAQPHHHLHPTSFVTPAQVAENTRRGSVQATCPSPLEAIEKFFFFSCRGCWPPRVSRIDTKSERGNIARRQLVRWMYRIWKALAASPGI